MATIGLDKLYYSKITEDASGNETYATPTVLAKAISAELSVELAEATLVAVAPTTKSTAVSWRRGISARMIQQVITLCKRDGEEPNHFLRIKTW